MRVVLAAAILFAGCSRHAPERLDSLYTTAAARVRAGELPRAQKEAERGVALAIERHEQRFEWQFRLLLAEILLFSSSSGPALAQLGQAMPESPEFAPLAARRLLLQGQAFSLLGRVGEAQTTLDRAHQSAEAGHVTDVLAEVEVIQGNMLVLQQRYPEAELVLRRALDRAHAAALSYQEAGATYALGYLRIRRSRFDEAAPYFEQASRLAGPKVAALYSAAQQNLATCYSGLGEYDRAIQIQLENLERTERTGAKAYLDSALGELGHSLVLKGDLRRAVPYLERALAVSTEISNTRNAAVWASNLANAYIELGEWDRAEAMNRQSMQLRNSANLGRLYYNELNAASIAAGRGDSAAAAEGYSKAMKDSRDAPSVLWESEHGLGRLAIAAGRPAEAARHFDAAVAIVEKTRSGLQRTDFKLPFLTRLIRLYRAYVDALLQQGDVEGALAVADSSRAQMLAERSGIAPVRRVAPGAFRDIARRTNSVLLSYWLGPGQSHAWVVTAREIHHVELPPAGTIEPLIASYQDAVELQLADPARTRLPAGERLFAMLIEPVRQWIPAGSNVIVTQDGALHGLNLESLPVPGDTPRYWIQDVTISIAPSLALLAGRASPLPEPKRLLLVGDPAGADPGFPDLRYAAAEMAAVTQRFGGRPDSGEAPVLISRANATPDAYAKADPARFSAIHFTAHATANRESPLDSAVLLAGGKLYARDVMAIKLTAGLVTVSACRGVGVRQYSGEGLVGFAWAFLHAGARNVIAGLWDVNDESTSGLMDVLYRELAAGRSPAQALRTAKMSLAGSPGNLRKPYYWAPFQLYTVAP